MKKAFRFLTVICAVFAVIIQTGTAALGHVLPDEFLVAQGEKLNIEYIVPISTDNTDKQIVSAESSKNVGEKYNVSLKLFNIFPIKTAEVKVEKRTFITPCGTPFGIKMFTEGVLVVGFSQIETEEGTKSPALSAGLKEGDVIKTINGEKVNFNEDVERIIEESGGKELTLHVNRKNMGFTVSFKPVTEKRTKRYMAGFWVRDSSAGIGTLTFYNEANQTFGGLGHPICDIDTGEILPLKTGEIVPAQITGIEKGVSGSAGELKGYFMEGESLGTLYTNTDAGVFGKMNPKSVKGKKIAVAMCQEVKTGNAQIISTIDDSGPQYFDCVIEKINFKHVSVTKNMTIRITDQKLLQKTGGIVQGMSGSPIIQDNMLVGAVTHVFVNNPTCGYAIFAENMLESSQNVEKIKERMAS